MNLKLRQWQQEALQKALDWLLVKQQDHRFLINAAPGAGKTLASCAIAQKLFQDDEIDRVIVIAPRNEVVNQWADDFRWVTGRHMSKVTAADGDIGALEVDVCATWAAIQSLLPELQAMCQASRALVICDEHHHAAVQAAWGDSADGAFAQARFALILTGTPIRSDGAESVWLAYDNAGAIDHPDEGSYTLTYGEAVDLGYCRPVTFHRHEGKFSVDLDDGNAVQVSGHRPADLPPELKRVPGLQTALDFYKLARTPQYQGDGVTPLLTGYQATMLQAGSEKLTELRLRMPNAGGLVIAHSIEMAEYMVELLEQLEGERPILVHSNMPNPNSKIKAFRNTTKRWLVSVAMVSEGVDIKRLRVLAYLPNALTELAFRQAVGRVVRTAGPDDDTRAYVVMPSFDTFDRFARRVEEEMPPSQRGQNQPPRTKRCGACAHECPLNAQECPVCGYEFPVPPERVKNCGDCGAINPVAARECHACGNSFGHDFNLTLDEALRTGAIVRGMDIDEAEVQEAERIAPKVRAAVLRSGDHRLVQIVKALPDESWVGYARFWRRILRKFLVKTRFITASMLYDWVHCPHRVTMDAFGDPAARDEPNAFVELLWERGALFETEVIEKLELPFLDLSGYPVDERERLTLEAMDRGEELIYSGRISADNLLGAPDLLRQSGSGFVAGDIKSGAGEEGTSDDKKPKKHYAVQLALYTDILERLGRSAGRQAFVWDIHGEEVVYDLSELRGKLKPRALWDEYESALSMAQAALAREMETRPACAATCKLCHWYTNCREQFHEADDLTQIPELGRAKRDAMSAVIPTVAELAAANPEDFIDGNKTEFPGIGAASLRKFHARANLLASGSAEPYLRHAITFPEHRCELFFDIEVDPMRDVCYLHGFIERVDGDNASEQFLHTFAAEPTPESEKEAFAQAIAIFDSKRPCAIYYYSKYERTIYRVLQQKYPDVCSPEYIEDLFHPDYAIDLYFDVVKKHSEWPTWDHSIKTLAAYLGFAWRDTNPSGAASIEWFDHWVKSGDPAIRQRILDYNEDDCRATRVLRDGIAEMLVL